MQLWKEIDYPQNAQQFHLRMQNEDFMARLSWFGAAELPWVAKDIPQTGTARSRPKYYNQFAGSQLST